MRILFMFVLLLLPVIGAVGSAHAQEATPDQSSATEAAATAAPATDAGPDGDAEPVLVDFEDRFGNSDKDIPEPATEGNANFVAPVASPDAKNGCVPNQPFHAYGFYALTAGEATEGEEGTATVGGEVDFTVYSRVLYYSLTPGSAGNITEPTDWADNSPTRAAHAHGTKVDLVISNGEWATDSQDGLYLSKSYVLLNMVDEIVALVNKYEFDGVAVDFRIPADTEVEDSFFFFVKRLKERLVDETTAWTKSDLIETEGRKLTIVLDRSFADSLDANYAASNPDEADSEDLTELALADMITEFSGYVDLMLVDRPAGDPQPALETQVKNARNQVISEGVPESDVPVRAVIFPNDGPYTESGLDINEIGIWDVGNQTDRWGGHLKSKVSENAFGPKQSLSDLVCTDRGLVLNALTGITPLIFVLLVLSWIFYDFPRFVKKSTATLALWGLLGIALLVFVLLLYAMPTLDLRSTGVYVVASSFVIPVIYIVLAALAKMSRRIYP